MELLDKDGLSPAVRIWSVALLVAMVTFIIYLPALNNGFVNWDDDEYVHENPYIRSFDFKFFMWSFTSFYASNWHPLTWLSHGVDYALWGLNPRGHHLSSVILHSFNTFLLGILIVLLVLNFGSKESPSSKPAGDLLSRAILVSGVTALLFGIHPVHVESVAWVSERKDVLSTFFVLLSVISYVKYVIGKQQAAVVIEFHFPKGGNRGVKLYYILSLIFFILALMSKPMAVTLPAVLVILDIYPFERLSFGGSVKGWIKAYRGVLIEKVPFFFFSLVSAVLTLMAQQEAIKPLESYPLSVRVGVAIKGLIFYLWKMVLPVGLSPFYPHPWKISYLSLEYLIPITLIVAISIFCAYTWKSGRKIFAAVWAYYVVTLLPVIGIIQVGDQAAADRYTYIPSIGPFLMIGIGIVLFQKRISLIKNKIMIILPLMVILFSLTGLLTLEQIRVWKNSVTLWTSLIGRFPDYARAYLKRSNAYRIKENYKEAIKDLNRAIELDHEYSHAYNNRGLAYTAIDDYQSAIRDFTRAIEIDPGYAEAYNNRATVYIKLEAYQKVINNLDRAIELKPNFFGAYINRCEASRLMGNYQQAVKDCSKAMEIDRQNAIAYYTRGLSFYALGSYNEAIADFDRTVALNPENHNAYYGRGITYRDLNENLKAIHNFTKTIELKPDHLDAYLNRGVIFGKLEKFEEAIKDFGKAIELNPNYASAYYNRGAAYYRLGREEEALRDFRKAARLGDKEVQKILKMRGISW